MPAKNAIPRSWTKREFFGFSELIDSEGIVPSYSVVFVVHAFGMTVIVEFSMLNVM